jgi:hypothetical protein
VRKLFSWSIAVVDLLRGKKKSRFKVIRDSSGSIDYTQSKEQTLKNSKSPKTR